jgi:hypothetical protein
MFHDIRSPYGLTGVNAGDTEAVHERTLAAVHQQQLVEVQGQSDVLVMGVPYLGPYNVNSTMNPILATCVGLGYLFNSYLGQPVVRRGGAVILYHPLNEGFNQLHHPSYVDFYEEVLDPVLDVHPFYMWYWAAHAMDHVDEVIWVGGDRRVASRLGFRAATTLADALEMASGTVGSNPSITYLHNPPRTSSRTGSRTSARWPGAGAGVADRRCRARRSRGSLRRGRRCSRPTGRAAVPRRWHARWRRKRVSNRCSAPRCAPGWRGSTCSPASRAR